MRHNSSECGRIFILSWWVSEKGIREGEQQSQQMLPWSSARLSDQCLKNSRILFAFICGMIDLTNALSFLHRSVLLHLPDAATVVPARFHKAPSPGRFLIALNTLVHNLPNHYLTLTHFFFFFDNHTGTKIFILWFLMMCSVMYLFCISLVITIK